MSVKPRLSRSLLGWVVAVLIPTIGMRYGAETRVMGVAILVPTIGMKYGAETRVMKYGTETRVIRVSILVLTIGMKGDWSINLDSNHWHEVWG